MHIEINKELLNDFCLKNDFKIVTSTDLKNNNIYQNIVYKTDNNFIKQSIYPKDMPIIMNKDIWLKLIKINNDLKKYNKCLVIYDAYRPIEVQQIFWQKFYEQNGYYDELLVANPNKYGTHNIKINAIDIMLSNLDGTPVELPCSFDDFTGLSNISNNNCTKASQDNRELLINICSKHGLIVNPSEWWHYYDERIKEYGMSYNYKNTNLIPIDSDKVFILK